MKRISKILAIMAVLVLPLELLAESGPTTHDPLPTTNDQRQTTDDGRGMMVDGRKTMDEGRETSDKHQTLDFKLMKRNSEKNDEGI